MQYLPICIDTNLRQQMENSLVMTDLSKDRIDVDEIVKLLDAVGGSDPSVSEKPNREFPICLHTDTNLEPIGMTDLHADDEYGCLDVDEIMKLLKSEEQQNEAKKNSVCTETCLEQQSENSQVMSHLTADVDYVHEMMEMLNLCDLEASMIGADNTQALWDINWQHSIEDCELIGSLSLLQQQTQSLH